MTGTFGRMGFTVFSAGQALNPLVNPDMWQILAYGTQVYSTGLGATSNVGGPFTTRGQVDLSSAVAGGFGSSADDHSAEFHYDNVRTQYYWNLVMKRMGLLNTASWPDLTPSLGVRP